MILSYSVLGRALFKSPNYWRDEAAVFLLVGATFMTATYVQTNAATSPSRPSRP